MNQFQSQYPLSPRKFWKKFLPSIIPILILSILLGFCAALIPVMQTSGSLTGSAEVSNIIMWVVSVAIGAAVVLLAYNVWYYSTYIRTYLYEGADNFITIKKGVFTPKEIHVQYQKIQDVYVDQDLLDRMMGLYDVHIASATAMSGMEAHIDGVDAATADGLKNFFLQKIQGVSTPTAAGIPDAMPQASPVGTPAVMQFTGNITSQVYPIQGAWLVSSTIGVIFASVLFGVLGGGYVALRTTSDSLQIPFLPAVLVLGIGWFVLHFISLLIWKSNYKFQFLPEYIQFNTGILSMSERHLPYKSIQDVSISQSLLDRMFGLANVTIENAAQMQMQGRRRLSSNIKLVGLKPADAASIVEALKGVILTKDSSQMGL